MGVKRPFDEVGFQELSFKQAKQLDHELTPYAKDFSQYDNSPLVELQGERINYCKLQSDEACEDDGTDAAFSVADKDLETSVPLSWVTSSSSDEGAGFEDTSHWSHFPDDVDFVDPSQGPCQPEDGSSSLFSYFPTKEVPIGLSHQADLPPWNPTLTRKDCLGFNCLVEREQKLMGTCIVPMPYLNSSTCNDDEVGCGRRKCVCLDEGSMRCVQQHVNEARENLRETFGDKNFMELGFYEMGEEVADSWTEEDEQVFHGVIYSNPVSRGKRFWKHLALVFPTRTKKEIICYYFNVFILRRRTVQNRSKLLEIDSDDDEWQGTDEIFCQLGGDEEESIVESFSDQDIPADHADDSSQNDERDGDEDDYYHHSVGNGDVGRQYTIKRDGEIPEISRSETEKLQDNYRFDYKTCHLDGIPGKTEGDIDVEEHLCLSPKTQTQMMDFMGSVGPGSAGQFSRFKNDHHTKYSSEIAPDSNEDFGFGFVMESCDVNIWDNTYLTGLTKSVDLLPTSNMIEEIFGPYAWNSESNNEKH